MSTFLYGPDPETGYVEPEPQPCRWCREPSLEDYCSIKCEAAYMRDEEAECQVDQHREDERGA